MRRIGCLLILGSMLLAVGCGDDATGNKVKFNYTSDIAAIQAILDANGITGVLPAEVAICSTSSGAYRVEWLTLQRNDGRGIVVDTLPPELGNLTALRFLNLDNQDVRSLPSQIGGLRLLQSIMANNDSISVLPTQITLLTRLASLYLSANGLTALPTGIGSLKKLVNLDVSSNLLTALPEGITGLDSLQNFVFDYNHVCSLSATQIAFLQTKSLYASDWLTRQTCP